MNLVHSLAPWFLARYQSGLERTARENLCRVGYENWYPTLVDIRPRPLKTIPPKLRHLAPWFVRKVRRPRFPGYILIRPLPWCRYDVNRLFDLTGCGGIIAIDGLPVKIQDFDIELMRLAEARGQFDTWTGRGSGGKYRITGTVDDSHKEWVEQGQKFLNVDESRKFALLVDAFGRFATVISTVEEPENQPVSHRI